MLIITIGQGILLLFLTIIIFLPLVSFPTVPPNVIVIVADDLGRGDLGAYGSVDARTPALDALAESGIRLDNFYVQPVCTPSRYALLTGLHPNRAHDREIMRPLHGHSVGLRADEWTLAEAFKQAGYSTAIIGKWHLGYGNMLANPPSNAAADSEFHPNNHGFDYFFGALGGAIDYNTHWNGSRWPDWFENKQYIPDRDVGTYATEVFTRRAVEYIDTHAKSGVPFFLYVPYTAPHYGATTSLDRLERLQLPNDEGAARIYLSRFDEMFPSDTSRRKRYLAMVAAMDDGIGEIVKAVERNHIRARTLLIFISDNGADPTYGGANGPLRGGKGSIYEGGVRVPAIVSWPSKLAAGQVSNQLATVEDLFPTVLSLAGVAYERRGLDGVDLSSHLLSPTITIRRDVHIANCSYGHFYREGKWKYIRTLSGNEALFDLLLDESEATNVAAQYPGTFAHLRQKHADIYGAVPCP